MADDTRNTQEKEAEEILNAIEDTGVPDAELEAVESDKGKEAVTLSNAELLARAKRVGVRDEGSTYTEKRSSRLEIENGRVVVVKPELEAVESDKGTLPSGMLYSEKRSSQKPDVAEEERNVGEGKRPESFDLTPAGIHEAIRARTLPVVKVERMVRGKKGFEDGWVITRLSGNGRVEVIKPGTVLRRGVWLDDLQKWNASGGFVEKEVTPPVVTDEAETKPEKTPPPSVEPVAEPIRVAARAENVVSVADTLATADEEPSAIAPTQVAPSPVEPVADMGKETAAVEERPIVARKSPEIADGLPADGRSVELKITGEEATSTNVGTTEGAPPAGHERAVSLVPWLKGRLAQVEADLAGLRAQTERSAWAGNYQDELEIEQRVLTDTLRAYTEAHAQQNIEAEIGLNKYIFEQMNAVRERELRGRGLWRHARGMIEMWWNNTPLGFKTRSAVAAVGSAISLPKTIADKGLSAMARMRTALFGESIAIAAGDEPGVRRASRSAPLLARQYAGDPMYVAHTARYFEGFVGEEEKRYEARMLADRELAKSDGLLFSYTTRGPETLWSVLYRSYEVAMVDFHDRPLESYERQFLVWYMVRLARDMSPEARKGLFGAENIDAIPDGTTVDLGKFYQTGAWQYARDALAQLTPEQHATLRERHTNGVIRSAHGIDEAVARYGVEPLPDQLFHARVPSPGMVNVDAFRSDFDGPGRDITPGD